MRGLSCRDIEVDEIWGFIAKKRKNATEQARFCGMGDVWTFIVLDSDTKIVPTHLVGQRDSYYAKMFMDDLAQRLSDRIQLSSDALDAYSDAVERGFGANVDYGQVVKTMTRI